MLTPFPFGRYLLGPTLGPANSRLTNVAGKPLPFRRGGFSPPSLLLPPGSAPVTGPVDLTTHLLPHHSAPYQRISSRDPLLGLGARLEPRPIFRASSLGG